MNINEKLNQTLTLVARLAAAVVHNALSSNRDPQIEKAVLDIASSAAKLIEETPKSR